MKVVINSCFGGFSLSPLAVKRMAELNGKECYFFSHDFKSDAYTPISIEEAKKTFCFFAFTVPDPKNHIKYSDKKWADTTEGERKERGRTYDEISLSDYNIDRADPILIQVIEEIGSKDASGSCAKLQIIEIPDGTDYIIEEYDGNEHIAEKHRTWR